MVLKTTRILVAQSLTETYCLLLKREHVGYCAFYIHGWSQNWQLLPTAYRWTKDPLTHAKKEKKVFQHSIQYSPIPMQLFLHLLNAIKDNSNFLQVCLLLKVLSKTKQSCCGDKHVTDSRPPASQCKLCSCISISLLFQPQEIHHFLYFV